MSATVLSPGIVSDPGRHSGAPTIQAIAVLEAALGPHPFGGGTQEVIIAFPVGTLIAVTCLHWIVSAQQEEKA